MKPLILNNVSKFYGEQQAVANVSLQLEEGETLAVIGPNGAGKSTTIRMILDIIRPDEGDISVLGSPSKRLINH